MSSQTSIVKYETHQLNPILQDILLIIHPPILYIGYMGTIVFFTEKTYQIINGDKILNLERKKILQAQCKWTICILLFGITLGSWWAYYELGWGGYWYWDPVENVSLWVWLLILSEIHKKNNTKISTELSEWKGQQTSLLSSIKIKKITEVLKKNSHSSHSSYSSHSGMNIITLGVTFYGIYLVRSGTAQSVHSFAIDQNRGNLLMSILLMILIYHLYKMIYINSKCILFKLPNAKSE